MRQPDPTKSEAPTAATVEASVNVPSEHDHQETSIANPTVSVPANQIQAIVGELVQEDGRIYTTSMQVAEHFGKRHADVLRAIKKLACSQEFTERNFAQCLKINELANGKTEPYFRITRDGFVFLAMGFTGKEAAAWKEAYIVAFNKMEAELKRIKYAVNPDDALTAAQAETLRPMLKTKADLLPKRQQGSFMMKGWSKLKSHYKVGYRQIPQSEYTEAMSIVARHVTEWEVLDALPNGETINEQVTRLVQQLSAPNGYPVNVFFPLYKAICEKLGRPNAVLVDIQNLIDLYVDLGRIRNRIDGFGTLKSDLPPEWWQQQRIA